MKKLFVAAFAAALACCAADVSGSWSGSYYAGPLYLTLKQEGAKLSGTAGPSPAQQMLKFDNGQVDGSRVTFKVGPYQVDLLLEGDDLKGEMKSPEETTPLTITRVEALARRARTEASAPVKPFDLATVKPNKSGGITTITGRGGSIRPSPGQIAMENVTLWKALGFAYGIGEDKDYAITGPAWLKTERYDIVAKLPPNTTWEQRLRMFQALLAERFKMAVHRETRELPVYAMVPAKEGFKLREVEMGHGGFSAGRGQIKAQKMPLAMFAERLSQIVDRPVLDETGIKGAFDFTVEFTPEDATPGDAASGPSIFTAIQQQLGLKLEARKGSVEVLVVDRADRVPIEN
jgi:uncharacterized protein (TIGR03435 family)